jgi:CDP-glycerol glycerophosphotransferase
VPDLDRTSIVIIGSRATRDIFDPRLNPSAGNFYSVDFCQLEPSVLSLMSDPISWTPPDYGKVSGEPRMELSRDVEKTVLACIASAKPHYVLLDFFGDVFWGCLQLRQGRYLTRSDALYQTRYYRQLRRDHELNEFRWQRDPDLYLEAWEDSFTRFLATLRQIVPNAHIVLNQVRATDKLQLPGDRETVPLSQHRMVPKFDVAEANELWSRLDHAALAMPGLCKLEPSPGVQASDDDHPRGTFYVNFTPDYYADALAALHRLRIQQESLAGTSASASQLADDLARLEATKLQHRNRMRSVRRAEYQALLRELRPSRFGTHVRMRHLLAAQPSVKTPPLKKRVKQQLRRCVQRSPHLEEAWRQVRQRMQTSTGNRPVTAEVAPRFGRIVSALTTLRWPTPTVMEIGGWVYSHGVTATASRRPSLDLWIETQDGSLRVRAVTAQRVDPEINRTANDPDTDYSGAGFLAQVDVTDVIRARPATWRLRYRLRSRHPHRIEGSFTVLRSEGSAGQLLGSSLPDGAYLRPAWSSSSGLQLTIDSLDAVPATDPSTVTVTGLHVNGGGRPTLEVSGSIGPDGNTAPLSIGVRGPQGLLQSVRQNQADRGFRASVPLWTSSWGRDALPPVRGTYRLTISDDRGERQVELSDDCVATLPKAYTDEQLTIRLERTKANSAQVVVGPPFEPAEVGAFAQAKFGRRYAKTAPMRDGSIYFETFSGRSTTDSPRAIYDELVRRGDQRPMYWGVADHSVPAPAGSEAVVKGSDAWWKLLSQASYFVHNAGSPRVLRLDGGQVVLQAWHGTPLKLLGMDGLGRSGSDSIAAVRAMTANWTYLLAQNPYSAEIFRRAYLFERPILQLGYPRNDTLVKPIVSMEEVRRRVGVPADSMVVLYAPTWRDGDPSIVGYLDPAAFSAELGNDSVVLLRGHNHTLPAGRRQIDDRVIDVTTYPEVNELMILADVLITDYSSLMFDFSVTGKPMLFYVPDLEHYRDERRGLYFDLRQEAPGPVVTTRSELLDAFRELPTLVNQYKDRYERWRERFNPLDDGSAASRVVDAVF